METNEPGTPHPPHDVEPDSPGIGVDDWVRTVEERLARPEGRLGRLRRRLETVPRPQLVAGFLALAAFLPLITANGYVLRVGTDTLLYVLLALGLNVVVGWAGLLDLGYVAFYGIGAYGFAMLASPKFGIHLPTPGAVLAVVAGCVLVGFVVGLPSRRLVGDYLAIVTLFFGQLFVTVFNNGNRVSVLGFTRGYDVTGGPNGIANIDPLHFFGHQFISVRSYFYASLVVVAAVLLCLYSLNDSRTGRAWRALREDALAAELLGSPVDRLKLYAFALGAGVAGLTGTLFASLNTGVFVKDFDAPLLITVYAMLILGGSGTLGGAIVGALVVNVSLEVLRTPDHATWVVYILLVATLVLKIRPARTLAAVVAGTVALGYAVHTAAHAVDPSWTGGSVAGAGWLGDHITWWVVVPLHQSNAGNVAVVLLIALVIALTAVDGWLRKVVLGISLYVFAFAWENRLVVEPSITRLILVGAILIVLMNARPQGLLGSARVEIV